MTLRKTQHAKYLHSSEAVLAVLQLSGGTADLLPVSAPQPGHVAWFGGAAGPDALQGQVDGLVQLDALRLAPAFRRKEYQKTKCLARCLHPP